MTIPDEEVYRRRQELAAERFPDIRGLRHALAFIDDAREAVKEIRRSDTPTPEAEAILATAVALMDEADHAVRRAVVWRFMTANGVPTSPLEEMP